MLFFYMHNGEHGLPLVANAWLKTGCNWFEGKEDKVNHTDSYNDNDSSKYNKAKALVKDFDFSDDEEGNSREEEEEEENFDDTPLPDIDNFTMMSTKRTERRALHDEIICYY
jgi:hypothetical protein